MRKYYDYNYSLGGFLFLLFLCLIVPTLSFVKMIQFNQNCAGYLKQAADANTPEIALERITKALDYIEAHNLTYGYTSVIYKTEDENVGFWYENIKACKSELEQCIDGTQLEKSNVLMKVRESLTDNGESGTVLTIPEGISRYPHNWIYGIFNLVSFILGVIFLLYVFAAIEERW